MAGPDLSPRLDERRQRANLALIARGEDFSFGDPAALPWPVAQLQALNAGSPGVLAVHDGGLTAEVLCVKQGGRRWAVKRARAECRVRNRDGQTSFLNELQRHAELAPLRLPGVLRPVWGSLRSGLIVSPWVDGRHPGVLDERQARSLLTTGCALIEHGFFEWDWCAGNLLDDGEQLWTYDFGYCYRFDPLTQLNTAGDGTDCPQFHLAERIESRLLFGALLEAGSDREALPHFLAFKRLAVAAYDDLAARLARRGAAAPVLAYYGGLAHRWRQALTEAPESLYLASAWRAHANDLADDLHGQTCTPRTLKRAAWLQHTLRDHEPALRGAGTLSDDDQRLASAALRARYAGFEAEARRLQI
jgi:hypothetical protein